MPSFSTGIFCKTFSIEFNNPSKNIKIKMNPVDFV